MDYANLLGKMRSKRLTQSDVAKKIGVSATTLNKKLRGHTDFTQSEICGICEVLGISAEELPDYFFVKKL